MANVKSNDIKPSPPKEIATVDVEDGELKSLNISKVDEAEIFLREHDYDWGQVETLLSDKAKLGKLIRKVDWIIMPLLCGTYCLQYIDKQALSYSAVFDLLDETNLTGDEYSWLGSIFYFGYLFWEYPASYIAQRFKMGKFISLVVVLWGAVLMLTAAAHDFAGLAACRFFLGCLEAPITPCFMLIVGAWYSRQGQPARAGLFYCFNGVGAMIGGVLTYGIGQVDNFPVYQAIYLVTGGLTVLWGILLFWRLPDHVLTTKLFTTEEKLMIVGIGKRNQTGFYNHHIKLYQIKEVFMDLQVWICFLFATINELVNGGIANFGKLIIKGMVNDPLKTVALGIPQGAFTLVYVSTGPWLATKYKNARCYIMALYLIPSIIGSGILWKLPQSNEIGRLFGYYITSSYVGSLVIVLQMPACNLRGYTKRVTGTAFVFLGYCLGNIIGPHAFLSSEAPYYQTGCEMMMACAICELGLAVMLRVLLVRRNRIRDRKRAEMESNGEKGGEEEGGRETLLDQTDFEDVNFRYQY
ncbi:MAG: hypothetical protein M1834_006876 [Cirrosporium novae-zelandiae]|nr:MAG: hypothetical protein M1834_006876 [Cirrosporium novae-zelandiae]